MQKDQDFETCFRNLLRFGKEETAESPDLRRNVLLYVRERAPENGLEVLAKDAAETLEKHSGRRYGNSDDSIYRGLELNVNSDEYLKIYEHAEALKNDYLENLANCNGELGENLFRLALAGQLFGYLESVPEEEFLKRRSSDEMDEPFMENLKTDYASFLKKESGKNRSYLEALIRFTEAASGYSSATIEIATSYNFERAVPLPKNTSQDGTLDVSPIYTPYASRSRTELIEALGTLASVSLQLKKAVPLYQSAIAICNDAKEAYPDFVPEQKLVEDGVESQSNFKKVAEKNLSDHLNQLSFIDKEVSEISRYL